MCQIKKILSSSMIILLLLAIYFPLVEAQSGSADHIVINEISGAVVITGQAANGGNFTYIKEHWIEVYNPTSKIIDLAKLYYHTHDTTGSAAISPWKMENEKRYLS